METLSSSNTEYHLPLPSLLLIKVDSIMNYVNITSEADIKKYKWISNDIIIDLELKKLDSGILVEAKFSEKNKESTYTKLEREIDKLNRTVSQIKQALEKSNKDLMDCGRNYFKKIKMESAESLDQPSVTKNDETDIITLMIEYQLLSQKLEEFKTESVVINDIEWSSSFILDHRIKCPIISIPKLNKKIIFSLIRLGSEIVANEIIVKSETKNVYFKNRIYTYQDSDIEVGTKVFSRYRNHRDIFFATVVGIINTNPIKYQLHFADNDKSAETIDKIEPIHLNMKIKKYDTIYTLSEINEDYHKCKLTNEKGESLTNINLLSFRPDCLYKEFKA